MANLKSENKSISLEIKEQPKEKPQYYISPDKTASNNYKHTYKAVIYFDEGCEMENIRAYTIIHNIKDITSDYHFFLWILLIMMNLVK